MSKASTRHKVIGRRYSRFSLVPSFLANALWMVLPVHAATHGPLYINNGSSILLGEEDVVRASGSSKAVWVSGSGSSATINGSHIEALGSGGGVHASGGGQITLRDAVVFADGNTLYATGVGSVIDATNIRIGLGGYGIGSAGLQAHNGGVIRYGQGDATQAESIYTFSSYGAGSELHITDLTLSTEKEGRFRAGLGGFLTVRDSQLSMAPTSILSGFNVSDAGSRAEIYNSSLEGGWFDVSNAGSLHLENVTANSEGGSLRVMGNRLQRQYSAAEIVGGRFTTFGGYGINLNTWAKVVARDAVFNVRDGYSGVWMAEESYLQLSDSAINTWNHNLGHGVDIFGGQANIQRSEITTYGDYVYGLRLTSSTAGLSRVTASESNIRVMGDGGGGLFLGGYAVRAHLEDVTIQSDGDNSFGIVQMNTGRIDHASGLNILMSGEGAGAYRSYLTEFGNYWNLATFNDSTIETLSGPAFWQQGSNHALVVNGSDVTAAKGKGLMLRVSDTVFTDGRTVATGRIDFTSDASVLRGDVAVDSATAFLDMQLKNGTVFSGSLLNNSGYQVSQLALDSSSRWNVLANSSMGTFNHAGTVVFEAPVGGVFKTVTVSGDYVGQGGHWLFNRALGDDASLGDQLIIQGNSSGTATVGVLNAGGAGAQTSEGIRLISVAGRSEAEFTLQGRAVAGLYDYFLFKGGVSTPNDGNWYLRSELNQSEEPEPEPKPEPEPEPKPKPKPEPKPKPKPKPEPQPGPTPSKPQVERPEPAVYVANQRAARSMFQHGLYDRAGDPAAKAGSDGQTIVWMHARDSQPNKREDSQQVHVEGDASSMLLGIGRRLATDTGGELQAGVMLGQGRASNRSRSQVTGYAARGEVEGRSVGLYGTWLQDAKMEGGVYVDGWLQYGRFHNSVRGDGLPEENYKSHSWTASAEAGYTLPLSRNEQRGVYVEPQLQVIYSEYDADRVVESNGTVVRDESDEAITTRLGVRLYSRETSSGQHPVNPYVAVNWWLGGNKAAISVDGESLRRNTPRDMIETKAGVQVNLSSGWRGWGEINSQAADGIDFSEVGAQVGVSYNW
ncbi:autotransporter outer membrane beta-barrel domain-containing protein [Ectopseudomonas mendocina]|uniref:Autotransporter outer membrane beta-barrel domain-containing protein n=1 Tax=Ectopseudomonas mendocina TaxID=300 RepID=A0ABZ2RJI8_ECTME